MKILGMGRFLRRVFECLCVLIDGCKSSAQSASQSSESWCSFRTKVLLFF